MSPNLMGSNGPHAKFRTFIIFSFITTIQSACFTPDGSASTDLSCSSNSSQPAICCQKGYSCTTSNFCIDSGYIDPSTGLSANGIYIRGTCTDKTWNSPECGTHCLTGVPGGGELVVDCGGGTYCCTNSTRLGPVGAGCCNNDTITKFDAGVPSVFAIAGESSSSRISAPSSTQTLLSVTEVGGSSSSTAPASGTSPANQQARSENSSKAVAIGVGVTLGLLLVAVTAGAVWWIRKLNRKIGAVASESKEDVLRLSELSSFDKRMEFGNEGMKTEIGQGMERRVELDTFKYGRAVELP